MIIVDFETTGLKGANALPLEKQPSIIEVALVKVNDMSLKVEAKYNCLLNPGKKLPEKITEITGITDDMLKGQKVFADIYPDLCKHFLGEKNLIAHNLDFDASMLEFELMRIGKLTRFPWPMNRICTVEQTEHIKGFRLNLQALHEHLFGFGFDSAHRAENDTDALAKCTIELIKNGTTKIA